LDRNFKKHLLIIEDFPEQMERYRNMGDILGMTVFTASHLETAFKTLDEYQIDIVLTDIHLADTPEQDTFEGFDILKKLKDSHPEILPIVMSSDQKIETYHGSIKLGAMHYIKKPIISAEELKVAIQIATEKKDSLKLKKKTDKLWIPAELTDKAPDGIVMPDGLRDMACALAEATELNMIITGETGVGKEEFAKIVHKQRCELEKQNIPFVVVNCAGLDPQMTNSILFGHEKGSFTGSMRTTTGLIAEASGGLLFLDEVHCLPIEIQQKLLRVTNDGSYHRVGSTKVMYSKFQSIVATTKNLNDMVNEGKFLLDLHMRLSGVDIEIPPLRERLDDIDVLIPLFLAKEKAKTTKSDMQKIIKKCKELYWKGNIRQLYKCIKTLTVMSSLKGEPISVENFPIFDSMKDPASQVTKTDIGKTDSFDEVGSIAQEALTKDGTIKDLLEPIEKAIIKSTLNRHRHLGKASEILGVSRSTLDKKRKDYGLG